MGGASYSASTPSPLESSRSEIEVLTSSPSEPCQAQSVWAPPPLPVPSAAFAQPVFAPESHRPPSENDASQRGPPPNLPRLVLRPQPDEHEYYEGQQVEGDFYGTWHRCKVRRVNEIGLIEVLWEDGTYSELRRSEIRNPDGRTQ